MKSLDEQPDTEQWTKTVKLVTDNWSELGSHKLRNELFEQLKTTCGYEAAGWTFEYVFDFPLGLNQNTTQNGIKVFEFGEHIATIHNQGCDFVLYRTSDGNPVAEANDVEKASALIARLAVGEFRVD